MFVIGSLKLNFDFEVMEVWFWSHKLKFGLIVWSLHFWVEVSSLKFEGEVWSWS